MLAKVDGLQDEGLVILQEPLDCNKNLRSLRIAMGFATPGCSYFYVV